jgi:hypothetical protein
MLTHQQLLVRRLERLLLAFFLLAALFLLAVYVAAPSLYTQTLLLQPSPSDRYPFPVTLFLVVIVGCIAVLMTLLKTVYTRAGEEFDRERLLHLFQLDLLEHQSIHKGYEHE